MTRAKTISLFKESVRRDLESLLNARNSYFDLPAQFKEAGSSALVYGLPDFSSLNVASAVDCESLCAAIQRAIGLFEPRLSDVSAAIVPGAGSERSLRVRIDGRLRLDPVIERVTFDVVMPLGGGKYEIRDSG